MTIEDALAITLIDSGRMDALDTRDLDLILDEILSDEEIHNVCALLNE